MKPEAGKAEVYGGAGRCQIAERNQLGLVGDLCRLAVLHLEDVDPVLVEKPAMKELRLEREFFAAPERALRQEPDGAIMVVVDVGEIVGQFFAGLIVRFGG